MLHSFVSQAEGHHFNLHRRPPAASCSSWSAMEPDAKKPRFAEPRITNIDDLPEIALVTTFNHIQDATDRSNISLVCKRWYEIDRFTRKEVTVACCYSIDPSRLTERFTNLTSVRIKGKPRASMFRLIPDDWGGYAGPWISEVAKNCRFLVSVHLRRMVVSDKDLAVLAAGRGDSLNVIKLDRCTGFSTAGLLSIARSCKKLKALVLDDSTVDESDGEEWLPELAHNNPSLEVLNFAGTELSSSIEHLQMVATSCKSLTSLKVNELDSRNLRDLLNATTSLRELGGVMLDDVNTLQNLGVRLPSTITSLVGLCYLGARDGDEVVEYLVRPIAHLLKKIDLQFAFLTVDGHCNLLRDCSNLEHLEVFNAIGDEGLEVIAKNCKNLRRLRVERGDQEAQQGFITQKGLISVAKNCHKLEYIAAYVSDINNEALKAIAENCKNLKDFRVVLLDEGNSVSEYPLDEGVIALVRECRQMHRLALYLRRGFLTDQCMGQLGEYGKNLKWVLFGLLGESDLGLDLFAGNCPNLEKLEIRDCVFSESGIASSVLKMRSLKFIWVQGYRSTNTGQDLLPMHKQSWNVEVIPESTEPTQTSPPQFLAYRSLAGKRGDNPETVICLG